MTSQVTTTPGSSRRSATLLPSKTSSMLVGADALSTAFNLRHLGKGPAERAGAFGMRRTGLGPTGGGIIFGLWA